MPFQRMLQLQQEETARRVEEAKRAAEAAEKKAALERAKDRRKGDLT